MKPISLLNDNTAETGVRIHSGESPNNDYLGLETRSISFSAPLDSPLGEQCGRRAYRWLDAISSIFFPYLVYPFDQPHVVGIKEIG